MRPRSPDERGRLSVDPTTFQTAVPHIYAAGDVIGFPEPGLDLDGAGPHRRLPRLRRAVPPPPEFFPYGIYSVPEISTVGMTEEQVREQAASLTKCGIARFRETSRGHIMGLQSRHS